MRGFRRSPTTSQIALPNARDSAAHLLYFVGVLPVRHHAPMEKFLAIDDALGAELHAEVDLAIVADDADRNSAFGLDDLNRHASEPARRAPNQHDVVVAHGVRRPSHQHAIRGRAHQRRAGGFFPGEMLRLRHTLMRLHAGELREAAPVGFVAPDFEGRIVHRIVAVADRGAICDPIRRNESRRGRRP